MSQGLQRSPRPLLASERLSPKAAAAVASYHAAVVAEVSKAVDSEAVVVVGMAQNPFVKKARHALEEAGVPFRYLEYGSYLSKWKERLAIKMWSGWPTFPQVYVKGSLLGGCTDLQAALADGSLAKTLGGGR